MFHLCPRYLAAIDLCVAHRVRISDEMAEELTPPKDEAGPPADAALAAAARQGESKDGGGGGGGATDRNEVLGALARACKKQGSFTLACKKFTQAGDRERAMKCLLKAGDTKALCYYATVSRNRNIYILAANYLQALDWQSDPDLMKNIVTFYTKAKAFEQLAAFFDSYAQVERRGAAPIGPVVHLLLLLPVCVGGGGGGSGGRVVIPVAPS